MVLKGKEVEKKDLIICRCEEITTGEIVEAIRTLDTSTVDGVKRITRAGMGRCQGKSCRMLVERLISQETGIKPGDLPPPSIRSPVRPVKIGVITRDGE